MTKRAAAIRSLPGLCLTLAVLWHSAANSSPATTQQASDEQVAQLTARLRQADVVVGEFRQQRTLSQLNKPLSSSGKFIFWKPAGLYWETDKPQQQAFTFTKERTISWSAPGVPQKQQSNRIQQKKFSRFLLSLFSFDPDTLEKQFATQWFINGEHWELRLKPRKSLTRRFVTAATLSGSEHIEQLELITAKQEKLVIDYINSQQKASISTDQCIDFFAEDASFCEKIAHTNHSSDDEPAEQ